MPTQPTPKVFLDRLRSIYCRHKSVGYEEYNARIAAGRILFCELVELVEVLFTEIQHVGLVDFIFQEAAAERRQMQERAKEIKARLGHLGTMMNSDPLAAAQYRHEAQLLIAEGNALNRRLKDDA